MANSKYSAEWFQQKAAEISDTEIEKLEQDAQKLRNEFLENYAPKKLKQLSGVKLLRRMFYNDEKDNNNLSCWLEITPKEFGSLGNGRPNQFRLYYSRNNQKWVTGSGLNSTELSESEAIQEAENIRDQLLSACEILENAISSNKSFDAIETYINLNEEFTNRRIDIIRYAWVRKYLFVYFYDKKILPDSYSKGYLKKVLKQIDKPSNEDAFVMMGRLILLGKKYRIPLRKFGKIISDIYNTFKDSQVEEEDDDDKNYWLAGFCFGGNDTQIERFVRDGIWEGIGDEKCNKLIESINIDDIIILKSTYVLRKKDSVCGISAVGIVKSKPSLNANERYEVKVQYYPVIKINNKIIKIVELIHPQNICLTTIGKLETPEIIKIVNSIINGDYKNKTTTTQIDLAQTVPQLNSLLNMLKHAHNLILTGAPGTGKTHLAHEIAKEMGAETEFVQFHPSYDYSDFVEGLRPTKSDSDLEIHFKQQDGVFKKFCKKAVENLRDATKPKEILQKENQNKDRLMDFLEDAYQTQKKIPLKSGSNEFEIIEYDDDKITVINQNEITRKLVISTNKLVELLNKVEELNNVNNIQKYHKRNYHCQTDSYEFALYHEIKNYKYTVDDSKEISDNKLKNFVFIIDEINRGELSKIFGELFFAIDPGYRVKGTEIENFIKGEGKREFIPPKTQYQNLVEDGDVFAHGFFIPENLYIIGTMNDIDRSVESMDFAIRRRFNWMEIQPDEFCDQMWQNKGWAEKAKNAMKAINDIIKNDSNLGKAYQIGPAYFLKLDEYVEEQDDIEDEDGIFKSLWENNLEPLIREYLRGIPECKSMIKSIEEAYFGAVDKNS